jgi:rRNA processing protein Krr1/Pno1
MADGGAELSKSARKRANQKARAAAEAEAPAAPAAPASKAAAPAPAPKGGYPAAEPKAKAKAKAEPAAPVAKAKAEPKAKAEAKAQPKAEAKAKPKAEPAAQPKSQAKAKAKTPAKQGPTEEEIQAKKDDVNDFTAFNEFDDGTGGEWAVETGKTKKKQKQEEKAAEEKKLRELVAKQGSTGGKHIPGMASVEALQGQRIPGMGPVSQSVNASIKVGISAEPIKEEAKVDNSASAAVKVPDERIGVVIGPKGKNIKMIQEKTGASISTSGSEFVITGPPKGVAEAEMAIKSLIEKGYTYLAYEDFSEEYVMVLDKKLPDIIGKKGAIIMKLKEELKVEVNIPKNIAPGKKCKVTLAGPKREVQQAKEAIEHIIQYQHHELTHPGEIHEELEVPSWAYAWIIGTKGSELRHIQNNYKVRVSIPREAEGNVLVVGLKDDVPRASAYIWKIIENGKDAASGKNRTDVGASDEWGDEGPEEDWMKAYMYKR